MKDKESFHYYSSNEASSLPERNRKELQLIPSPPIGIEELLGRIPQRSGVTLKNDIYEQLAQSPIYPFQIKNNRRDNKEYLAIGPHLNAEQLNSVLYFAAPNKGFGLDTDDIINDWHGLYEKEVHEQRKNAHTAMPGWGLFEASRHRILGVIERNYPTRYSRKFVQQDPEDVVIPVLKWSKNQQEQRYLSIDQLTVSLKEALSNALPEYIHDAERLDKGMGIVFLSAYSPEQTQWKKRDGYSEKSKVTQQIGSTQVLPYAIRQIAEIHYGIKADDMSINPEYSPILAQLDRYIDTGR